MMTALSRAMHLLVDSPPFVFEDAFAWPLVGPSAEALLQLLPIMPQDVLAWWRASFLHRSRVTEDALAEAVGHGVRQYVILGAGLDSFAWRQRAAVEHAGLAVFEVDHPASQDWKRSRVEALQLPTPAGFRFVAVDFAVDDLLEGLRSAGFDATAPGFFSWLGVSVYLPCEAIRTSLSAISALASGTSISLSYALPAHSRDADEERMVELIAPLAAARGEPWLSYFDPSEIESLCRDCAFTTVRHHGPAEAAPFFSGRVDGLRLTGAERVVIAST